MTDTPTVGWPLVAGLIALVALTVVVSWRGRLGIGREAIVAVGRAVVQLAIVASVIAIVLRNWWSAVLFAVVMFCVAVWTASGRIDARPCIGWIAGAMGSAVISVTAIVFASGASPFTGPAIVPIVGIVIGNTMTAVGLAGRRFFEAIDADRNQIEAALALGLQRAFAINLVIERRADLAMTPILDQTRTVGLVTLPGAFVGVLLGGGSAAQAAASQILVLVGILAAQTIVVVAVRRLVARGLVLSPFLASTLPPA